MALVTGMVVTTGVTMDPEPPTIAFEAALGDGLSTMGRREVVKPACDTVAKVTWEGKLKAPCLGGRGIELPS